MLSTDREEFEAQLELLCAGFNVPKGDRSEAYWKGLAKMSLPEFSRCVETALGADGPEKFPTSPQIWNIRRKLKSAATSRPVTGSRAASPTVQELLMEYTALQLRARLTPLEFAQPWTYVYREWIDDSRPKGFERCAECTGVVIELENGERLGFSVASMLADTEAHAAALRMFQPGPLPSSTQMDAYRRGKLEDFTRKGLERFGGEA